MFRKRSSPSAEAEEAFLPPVDPRVLEILDRLEKAGVQLLVRAGNGEVHTSAVVGLGRDCFFIDTFSPPEGDQLVQPGTFLAMETLYQGISYHFQAKVLGRVRFVDELPAFRVEYPETIRGERRRRTPRVPTRDDASLSFLQPFACDAPVVNVSEGGIAFEYAAELGRLPRGALLKEVLLELGEHPVVPIQARVVGQVVCELGGLGLPRRYRVSLAFQGLSSAAEDVIEAYLRDVSPNDLRA